MPNVNFSNLDKSYRNARPEEIEPLLLTPFPPVYEDYFLPILEGTSLSTISIPLTQVLRFLAGSCRVDRDKLELKFFFFREEELTITLEAYPPDAKWSYEMDREMFGQMMYVQVHYHRHLKYFYGGIWDKSGEAVELKVRFSFFEQGSTLSYLPRLNHDSLLPEVLPIEQPYGPLNNEIRRKKYEGQTTFFLHFPLTFHVIPFVGNCNVFNKEIKLSEIAFHITLIMPSSLEDIQSSFSFESECDATHLETHIRYWQTLDIYTGYCNILGEETVRVSFDFYNIYHHLAIHT